MSLLGIDVGTTGCKAAVFAVDGTQLAAAYEEYDVQRPRPGWDELDAVGVWQRIRATIRAAVADAPAADPVTALCASSLGEAVVPVTADREILGPSSLNSDSRGAEFLDTLADALDAEPLYRITGNTLGNHYTLTKLLWLQKHEPQRYAATDHFLHWGAFVSFMLGADAIVDRSLANRTLLFDLDRGDWSQTLLDATGLFFDSANRRYSIGVVQLKYFFCRPNP